jgi:hypothetical protein
LRLNGFRSYPQILDGFAGVGFTLAVFDTADADARAIRPIIDSVDLCLLPVPCRGNEIGAQHRLRRPAP